MMRTCMLVLLVIGCKVHHLPSQYLGMDRAAVSCAYEVNSYVQQTCVGTGLVYKCVTEDRGDTWRCTELSTVQAEAGAR